MLQLIHDIHKGEPIFICGCGPSVDSQDLTQLDGFLSIGVNKFPEKYNRAPYWIGLDSGMCDYSLRDGKVKSLKFIWDHYAKRFQQSKLITIGTNYLWVRRNKLMGINSRSPEQGISFANCSSYAALHIAVMMGCSPIILIGQDFSWKNGSTFHFNGYAANKLESNRSKKGEAHKMPDGKIYLTTRVMRKMKQFFDSFPEFAKLNNIEIINATEGGILDSWPKATLKEVVERLHSFRWRASPAIHIGNSFKKVTLKEYQ